MIAYVKLFSDLELETYKNIVYNKYNLYTTSLVRFIAKRRINLISSLRQIYFSLTWTDQITTNLIQFDVKGSTYIHFWNKESLIGINWFFSDAKKNFMIMKLFKLIPFWSLKRYFQVDYLFIPVFPHFVLKLKYSLITF